MLLPLPPSRLAYKLLAGFVIVIVGLVLLSRSLMVSLQSQNPTFLLKAVEEAKTSHHIGAQTGELLSEEYGFQLHERDEDSLDFHIYLMGEKGQMTLQGGAVRTGQDSWQVFRADTVFLRK